MKFLFPFALALLLFAWVAFEITSYVRLDGDARALRNAVLKSSTAPWNKKIEINLGSFTVGLARTALHFAHLDPKAQTALRTVRAGEVGVYQLKDTDRQPNSATLLSRADAAMADRGFDRPVAVMQSGTFVAVYVCRKSQSPRTVKLCVVVIDGRQLVIASTRGNLEPLMPLIQAQLERHRIERHAS